ncbi:MAG TPA: acetolactate synthase small subunit [bacterium]|nr:acetolactate synthase small subunit [bacterium]
MEHQHIISVLVQNRFGVLARVAGLFSGRGFNIDSLSVGETQEPSISRMTIVSSGDDQVMEQINKQLNKLIDVLRVTDFTDTDHVERELVLIKVSTEKKPRSEVLPIVDIFRAKIVDLQPTTLTVEMTGSQDKIEAIIELLRPFGVKEIVRSGRIAIARG